MNLIDRHSNCAKYNQQAFRPPHLHTLPQMLAAQMRSSTPGTTSAKCPRWFEVATLLVHARDVAGRTPFTRISLASATQEWCTYAISTITITPWLR